MLTYWPWLAMGPNELVLSDVHLFTAYDRNASYFKSVDVDDLAPKYATSRFVINWLSSSSPSLPQDVSDVSDTVVELTTDEDGDLVVKRSSAEDQDVIVIGHSLETTLTNVGLQIWRGALLLSDYIIHKRAEFDGCYALELGAGAGLVSVVMAMFARHTICTDIGEEVLENCAANLLENNTMYKYRTNDNPVVTVKELDWLEESVTAGTGKFSWSPRDLELLDKVTVILAADVVYKNELTDSFFMKIHHLLSKLPAKTVLISIEKRLNFTLEDRDIACAEYDYFRACLDRLAELSDDKVTFEIHKIPPDFPRYLEYERVKQLELWCVKAIFR